MLKKRKKIPAFYVVLISLILLGALIAGIVLNLLWDFLYSYENNLPKYVARDLFHEYFESGSYQKLYELNPVELGQYEGAEQFEAYMHLLLDGKDLQHYEMTTGDSNKKQFRIRTPERKIADLFLKKTGEKASWGQDTWEFDHLELAEFVTQSVQVKVITGSTLFLNGVAVSDDAITEAQILTESCEYMPEGVMGMTYDVYTVDGLLMAPEIVCTTKDGIQAETYYDRQANQYVENITYDAALSTAYSQFAIEALQTCQRYLTNDANMNSVKNYVDQKSDFYNALRHTDTQWYARHIAHEYTNEVAAEFYRYSDEVFSCRYIGTQVITRTKTDIRYFDLDCVLYFHLVDGEYKVYDIIYK